MNKLIIASLISIVAIVVFSSCNKNKTYAQNLNEEKKRIERFIIQNDIKVLTEYPSDSVFQEKEFYLDVSSGLYYNVIDPGNSRRIKSGEEFYVRFKGLRYIESSDTLIYSTIQNLQPETLKYGNTSTYTTSAWVLPLRNVGDGAKVKMLVPFKIGTPNDIQTYKTAYYEEVRYVFEN
jgi:hypothetical protein